MHQPPQAHPCGQHPGLMHRSLRALLKWEVNLTKGSIEWRNIWLTSIWWILIASLREISLPTKLNLLALRDFLSFFSWKNVLLSRMFSTVLAENTWGKNFKLNIMLHDHFDWILVWLHAHFQFDWILGRIHTHFHSGGVGVTTSNYSWQNSESQISKPYHLVYANAELYEVLLKSFGIIHDPYAHSVTFPL